MLAGAEYNAVSLPGDRIGPELEAESDLFNLLLGVSALAVSSCFTFSLLTSSLHFNAELLPCAAS